MSPLVSSILYIKPVTQQSGPNFTRQSYFVHLHYYRLKQSPTALIQFLCPHTPSTGSQPERGPHACHNHTCVSLYALPLEKLFHPLPKFQSHSIAEFSPLQCGLHDTWDPALFSSHDLMSSGWALWRMGMSFLFIFVSQAPSSTCSDSTF